MEVGSRNHNLSIEDIEKRVVEEIKKMPIFDIKEIVFVKSIKIPVAYCIFKQKAIPIQNSFIIS